MQKATLQLEPLACPSCLQKIENAAKALEGVVKESVEVLFNSGRVRMDFDSSQISLSDIENAIVKVGYEVKKARAKAI